MTTKIEQVDEKTEIPPCTMCEKKLTVHDNFMTFHPKNTNTDAINLKDLKDGNAVVVCESCYKTLKGEPGTRL